MPRIVLMNVTLPIILSEKISFKKAEGLVPSDYRASNSLHGKVGRRREIRQFVSGSLVDSLDSGCIRKNYEICQKMESFNTVTDKNEAGLIFSQKHHLPAISFLEAHQSRIPKIRI